MSRAGRYYRPAPPSIAARGGRFFAIETAIPSSIANSHNDEGTLENDTQVNSRSDNGHGNDSYVRIG